MLTTSDQPPIVQNRSVHGGARLVYASDITGDTYLAKQWVRPPLHLSKAYMEHGWAISQLMSPTAGLLDGDIIEIDTKVEAGAKAGLISPAACRAHTMTNGYATIDQNYSVGENAILDLWPAPVILQKDASLKQFTKVDLTTSSTLLLCEIISPGRVTFGEAFTFKSWKSKLRIRRDDCLLAFENFTVNPAQGGALDWRQKSPTATYASLYFVSPDYDDLLVEKIHRIEEDGVYIGASALRENGLGIKILANDGIALRKAISTVRSLLIETIPAKYPTALQRGQTFFN